MCTLPPPPPGDLRPSNTTAPCHKKNPGPAPDFVFVSDKVSAKTCTVYSTERNVTRVNLAAITEVLSGLNSDKPHGLKTVT